MVVPLVRGEDALWAAWAPLRGGGAASGQPESLQGHLCYGLETATHRGPAAWTWHLRVLTRASAEVLCAAASVCGIRGVCARWLSAVTPGRATGACRDCHTATAEQPPVQAAAPAPRTQPARGRSARCTTCALVSGCVGDVSVDRSGGCVRGVSVDRMSGCVGAGVWTGPAGVSGVSAPVAGCSLFLLELQG